MAVSAAVTEGSRLPAEILADPALLPADEQPPRLPETVEAACSALEHDDVLCAALGEPLLHAFLAVRRAEVQLYAGKAPAEIAAATRWIY
jgi:glutamine synthetase